MKDEKDREQWSRIRLKIVCGFFSIFFAVVVARAFSLQVLKADFWNAKAKRQIEKTVQLPPTRGDITDRNGLPLASSVEMDSCFAEPQVIKNVPETAAKLAPLLGMDRGELEEKLTSDGQKHFVWLQRQLQPDVMKRVTDLKLPGIGFAKETKRFYPKFELASQVVGFTGRDPAGLEGIELKYNSTILGNVGYMVVERDGKNRDVGVKTVVIKNPSGGNNISLTLDQNIQYTVEKELAKAVTDSGAKSGMALVMEPQTGKILAMANFPTFNPNLVQKATSAERRNHVVADSFEPGSTFKVLLISAALEERVISLKDTFDCELGSFGIGGVTIHDTHRYGRLSVSEVLKYSSNIGAAKIGRRLGQERLTAYLKNYGIGERTGIDLPGEAVGSIRLGQWYDADLATVSFGQGVSTTAIQLTTAISAVANNGVLMKPYLVERITDRNGAVVQQNEPQERRRVISPETSQKMKEMMKLVTLPGGTGTNAAVDGYFVAGKTGTAQKVDPATKRYSSKRTASFVGFVPVTAPKLTILVVVDEPKTSPYGGIVAAPAFSAIAKQTLAYLRVPPENCEKKSPQTVPVQTATTVEQTDDSAEGDIGYGSEGEQMPNLRGMSIRQVMQIMEKRKLNIKLLGSGRAVEQQPAAGNRITPTDPVWVRFAPSA